MSLNQSDLVAAARDLLERADPMTAGIWPRATALLTRQALEGGSRRSVASACAWPRAVLSAGAAALPAVLSSRR